jgi:hypothetical protein
MALPEPAGEQFYTDCRYQEGASATTQGGVVTESGNVTGWPVPAICRGKQDAAPANSQPPKSIAGISKEKRVSPYRFTGASHGGFASLTGARQHARENGLPAWDIFHGNVRVEYHDPREVDPVLEGVAPDK